jgi:hypothetical protein
MRRPPLDGLRVPSTELEDTKAVAVAFIMSCRAGEGMPDRGAGLLAGFRAALYGSLGLRRDALFEACDALACRPERVHVLAELCLEPECRRGHGGVYDAVNRGEVRIGRLRRALADDPTEVTAAQVREVIGRLRAAGRGREGDPDVIVVLDSGYDLTRLAWLLRDLPADVTGRLRSDRVMYFPAPPREPGATGRPSRHGVGDPATWPEPRAAAVTQTSRYGTARARAWGRLHQQLAKRGAWERHQGELPVVEGTLIRLDVGHLPGRRAPRPGPGRPAGSRNQRPATRHDVGKTVKREESKKKTRRRKG